MAELKKYLDTTALGTLVEQIKAEDGKVLKGAKDYADSLASNYDAAGAAGDALKTAKEYTDALANGAVATNAADIATLKGTGEGSVAKAVADSAATLQSAIEGVDAKADKNAEDIAAINDGENGVLAQAKAYADAEDAKVEQEIADLEAYVGTFAHDSAKTVVEYINAKTDGIATSGNLEALGARVTAVEGDVTTIKGDYLKDADKTELAGDIADVQAAVETEAATARAAEEANAAAIKAISDNYLKAADKTELQGNIDAVNTAVERLTNGVSADEIDGVNDLIEYVKEHRDNEVVAMLKDISDNASAIEGVAGRMDTAEGKIAAVEGAVATKVEKSVYDEKIAALEGADSGLDTRLQAVEAKFGNGEGNVEAQIEAAKTAAIEAAAADAASKDAALKTEIETAYKKYADDEDAKIESRVSTLEADTHTHGNKALLDTYTQTEANLADAVAKKHEHANKAELDLIASGDKAKWDAAEGNAKAYADSLDAAMTAKVEGVDARVKTLEETIVDKAEADDLADAVARIAANETAIAANTSAINSFTPITSDEVTALFA